MAKPTTPPYSPVADEKQLMADLRTASAQAAGLANLMFFGDMPALDEQVQAEMLALMSDLSHRAFSAASELAKVLEVRHG